MYVFSLFLIVTYDAEDLMPSSNQSDVRISQKALKQHSKNCNRLIVHFRRKVSNSSLSILCKTYFRDHLDRNMICNIF